jgi:hypothetical protein
VSQGLRGDIERTGRLGKIVEIGAFGGFSWKAFGKRIKS